jgi:molybdate transport system substrate-binding protein
VRTLSVVIALLLVGGCGGKKSGRKVRIAAASDLQAAFLEVGKEFTAKTKIAPEFQFSSSGLLAKQIEQGAPYFLFASANKEFTEQVAKSGRCDAQTKQLYARGRIVVWTAPHEPAPKTLDDLARPEFAKIAIANPEHAPYGLAARQALQKAGVWDRVAPRMVLGENVSATMLFAKNGDVDAAIVALSLAVVTKGGSTLPVDPALHEPLDQQLIVCGTGSESDDARQFAAFLASREGREIMTRYGFTLPEGAPQP